MTEPGVRSLARGLRTTLALLALFAASTGQVGSCSGGSDRRPVQRIPDAMLPEALRGTSISTGEKVEMHVRVSPSPARVGEAIRYRAHVVVEMDQKVRFDPPQSGGEFTWSDVRAGREHPPWWRRTAYEACDSVWFEARLQVFTTGVVSIPGPVVHLAPTRYTRIPTAHLVVTPTVTAADSNQSLRGLHGPLGAPWWEKVPLGLLVAGLALLVAWFVVLRKLRRRERKPVRRAVTPAAVPSRPRIDPAAEALRALFTLRAKKLPAQQRFGEHALELTAILRRFLEATVATPRPGDTSGELLERLRATRHEKADLERLEGLLGLWDRVKFARAPLTEAEAIRCEDAVEAYVRRVAQARLEAEAAAARAAAARAAAAPQGGGSKPPTGPHGGAPSPGAGQRPSSTMSRPASGAGPRPSHAMAKPPSGTGPRPTGTMSRPASGASGGSKSRSGPRPPAPEAA